MSEEAKQHQPLRIVRDTREQDGFDFAGFDATVETATLQSGDYSLVGFSDAGGIAIERKTLNDLLHSITKERDRFRRELSRLAACRAAALVVEQPQSALRLGHYHSSMTPLSAWQTILSVAVNYRIPILFADSREDAQSIVFHLLRHFARARLKELAALVPATASRPRPSAVPVHAMTQDEVTDAPRAILEPLAAP